MKRLLFLLLLIPSLAWGQVGGGGDVNGPTSATDNAVVKMDGTTGALIQNSGVIISDSNTMYGLTGLVVTGTATITLVNGTISGDLDPDQLSGDTVDDNSIDAAIVSTSIARTSALAGYQPLDAALSAIDVTSLDLITGAVQTETDPVFIASDAYVIDTTSFDTWNAGGAEADPVFLASLAASIDQTSVDTWDAAGAEADPVFLAAPAYSVDQTSLDKITSSITSVASDSTWTIHDSYPSGCSAGQYVSAIGDTLTCGTPAGGGGGSGIITSSAAGQFAFFSETGTVVMGAPTVTFSSGTFNIGTNTFSVNPTTSTVSFGNSIKANGWSLNLVSTITNASTAHLLENPNRVYVSGNYAYVISYANGYHTLVIIDVTNPLSPTIVGSLSTGMDYADGIWVSGKYAYIGLVSTGDKLQIVDVSNPSSPKLAGTVANISGEMDSPSEVMVVGKYAYVSVLGSDSMSIVDISNPSTASVVGTVTSALMDYAHGIMVQYPYAYVVSNDADALVVIDVSNPTSPTIVGSVVDHTNLDGCGDLEIRGKYAYVTDEYGDGLTTVDISNPTVPAVVSFLSSPLMNGADGIHLLGNYAIICSMIGDDLTIVDISNPASMSIVSSIPIDADDVYVVGNYAYVANEEGQSFQIYEIPGIKTPSLQGGDIAADVLHVNQYLDVAQNLNVHGGGNFGADVLVDGVFSARKFVQGTGTFILGGTGTVDFTLGNIERVGEKLYMGTGSGTVDLTATTSGISDGDTIGGLTVGTLTVDTEVYGVGWDSDNTVPTKDAVYDKVEALVLTGGGGSGIVTSSTGGQMAWYANTGTIIIGNPTVTFSSGVLTVPGISADGVTVDTEVYDATGWDSDLTVPTKDSVRDKIETIGSVSTASVGSVAFYKTSGTTVSGTPTIFISGGNVGIGTTSPVAQLDIYSSGTGTNYFSGATIIKGTMTIQISGTSYTFDPTTGTFKI